MLNFSRVPFRNEHLPRLLYGLAATALAIITLVHGVLLTRYLLREQEELDVKVEGLEAELSDLEARLKQTQSELGSKMNEVRTERTRFLTNIYRLKSFPWTALFNQLEALTPPGVRIRSISPGELGENPGEIEVNLLVVGRKLDDVLEMVQRLESDRLFTTVSPLSESENEREGGGIAAALTLRYLPSRAALAKAEPEEAPQAQGEGNKGPASPVNLETGRDPASEAPAEGTPPRSGERKPEIKNR